MPLFNACPISFTKHDGCARKILFLEKYTPEEEEKYISAIDEVYQWVAQQQEVTVEELKANVKVDIKKTRKRKERYPKPFYLRYEWENNRLFFVFKKVKVQQDGSVQWA